MKRGFIGVGNIGAPIASQLLSTGATWSDSAASVAGECEVVATCLPGPAEMEQVCLGPSGIVGQIKAGGLYIDHTTNSPLLVRHFCSALGVGGEHPPRQGVVIENALKIRIFYPQWTLPSLVRSNPLVWMAEVNGLLVDLRNASRGSGSGFRQANNSLHPFKQGGSIVNPRFWRNATWWKIVFSSA